MRLFSKVAILGALIVPLATVPASAQNWKWDINVNGGYSWYNKMVDFNRVDVASLGLTELVGIGRELKFSNRALGGAQLTWWAPFGISHRGNDNNSRGARFGLRANGTYTRTHLRVGNGLDLFTPRIISPTLVELFTNERNRFNLWGATGDVLIRFITPRAPREDFKFEALPYLALGLGAKWVKPRNDFSCSDVLTNNETFSCSPFAIGFDTTQTLLLAIRDKARVMGLVGLGSDWHVARHWAIRTEVGDRIWKPDLRTLQVVSQTNGTVVLAASTETFGRTVNEIYAQAGISYLFGVARYHRVAVAPAPRPSPPPPPPPVSREALTVCVIDPTQPGGIRMQAAYLVGGRDTVVVVNGVDQPFSSSLGNVMVASNADWFIRGQPLTVMTGGKSKLEYATYGTTRVIEPTELAFVGTVNGLPVYADRNDVAEFIAELEPMTRSGRDLGMILSENKTLREEFSHVKVLYVPMNPSGCTFQAVQLQEEVRKGK